MKYNPPERLGELKESELGLVPTSWTVRKLSETSIDIIDGDRGVNYPKQGEFKKKGYCLFLSAKNVTEDGFDFSDNIFISREGDERLNKGKLQRHDIVITTRGTVGNVGKYGYDIAYDNVRINSGMVIIRNKSNEFNSNFLYWLLRSRIIKQQFNAIVSGSAQPQLPIRDLKYVNLPIPSIKEQYFIATILDSLSSKMKLTKDMNRTLESIAQTLFKHWFIDFEFPDENGQPYKSSGGEMVDSELGDIPNGWSFNHLKDLGQIVCGKTPSTKVYDHFGEDYPFIKIPDMRGQVFTEITETRLSQKGSNLMRRKKLPPMSVCVSCIATPGLVTLTSVESYTNQQINSIICKDTVNPYYVYFQMKAKRNEIFAKGSSGTATLNLNTGEFSKIQILIPSQNVMEKFHRLIQTMFNRILSNQRESYTLTEIRGQILPKLISGKIRVPLEGTNV